MVVGEGRVLFIEFKTPTGKVSPHQLLWQKVLRGVGVKCEICYSFEEAVMAVNGNNI